jgi:uncharacterized membrane-anchored protein
VVGGFAGFVVAMVLQYAVRKYVPWVYWLAVLMVAVFGTMAADVLHVEFGVPYVASAAGFAIVLAIVFAIWHRSEGTLSIHSITTRRRELFYWLAVLSTFALGTAAGDLTAISLGLGFWASVLLFGGLIALPAIGWWRCGLNPIVAFWCAYVITRPLGASFADGFAKNAHGGLGLGDGLVAAVALVVFIGLVAGVTAGRIDVQSPVRLAAESD